VCQAAISAIRAGLSLSPARFTRHDTIDTGKTVLSCTMIVTDANAFTRAVHNRMPVLMDRPDLSGTAGTELLRPAAKDRLRMWPSGIGFHSK
jgi:putative SOS response-associated peptidase YedK